MTSPIASRGQRIDERMTALGITKSELAARAEVDRGTLDRALSDSPKMSERTWSKIERALDHAEDEVGMAESGRLVTTTIEFNGARITVEGAPADVAETARQILGR